MIITHKTVGSIKPTCSRCDALIGEEPHLLWDGVCLECYTLISNEPMHRCIKCSKEVYRFSFYFNRSLCDAHFTEMRAKEDKNLSSQRDIQGRMDRFKELCPIQYQENDHTLINEGPFNSVFNYKFGPQGILCIGASRLGKTTSCWRMLENLYVMRGIVFDAMTEIEFSQTASRHSRNRTLDSWLQKLCTVPVLFLDDIGHAAVSSKHLEDLSYVVEKRTSWKRPIIATTQFSDQELEEKVRGIGGQKTVMAILNRIKGSSKIVVF